MSNSIQKLIDIVESIEEDFAKGVSEQIIISTIHSAIPVINLSKTNSDNLENEEKLNELELRLSKILLQLK